MSAASTTPSSNEEVEMGRRKNAARMAYRKFNSARHREALAKKPGCATILDLHSVSNPAQFLALLLRELICIETRYLGVLFRCSQFAGDTAVHPGYFDDSNRIRQACSNSAWLLPAQIAMSPHSLTCNPFEPNSSPAFLPNHLTLRLWP